MKFYKNHMSVIPAKAGIQNRLSFLPSIKTFEGKLRQESIVVRRKMDSRLHQAGMTLMFVLFFLLFISQISFAAVHPSKGGVSLKELEDIMAGIDNLESKISNFTDDERNFLKGYTAYRHGNWQDALRFLGNLDEKLPIIGDHVTFYRAVSSNKEGLFAETLDLIDQLNSKYPASVWTKESKLEKAKALISLGRPNEALKVVFDSDVLKLSAMIEANDKGAAVNFARSLILNADSDEKIAEIFPLLSKIDRKFDYDITDWMNETSQQLILAENFTNESQWDAAVKKLKKIAEDKSMDDARITRAKWLLAKNLRWLHKYEESIKIMEELLNDPNARGFADDIMSTLAMTYTKNNSYDKAIALRQKMMDEKIASPVLMSYKVAFLHMDEGNYKEAIPLWRRSVAMKGEKSNQAKWYLAWSLKHTGENAQAVSIMDEMLKKNGIKGKMHDRLLYWKGRILLEMGKNAEARKSFNAVIRTHPNGYYAELAKRRLNSDTRDIENFVFVIPMCHSEDGVKVSLRAERSNLDIIKKRDYHARPMDSLVMTHSRSPRSPLGLTRDETPTSRLARTSFFLKLGLKEEANREIDLLSPKDFGGLSSFLSIAADSYAYDTTYRIATGGFYKQLKSSSPDDGSVPEYIWEAAYPNAYEQAVQVLTKDSDVDPFFVWSIMQNESAFRPKVRSQAGALGLMQLMPTTANRMMQESGSGTIDRRHLGSPSANILLGITYLKKLSELFPKNQAAWAAAYNAGEEAVGRWIKNGKLDDIEVWIEEIPYDETNLYVKKVLTSYWKYQRLYK